MKTLHLTLDYWSRTTEVERGRKIFIISYGNQLKKDSGRRMQSTYDGVYKINIEKTLCYHIWSNK